MSKKWARIGSAGVALAVGVACQSAAPRPPRTAAVATPEVVSGLVGQTLILRHRGDAKAISLKQAQLGTTAGGCDVAAQVRAAAFSRGTAKLTLETIGRPRTERRGAHQERCGDDQMQIVVSVSGFEPGVTAAELQTALGRLLQTPEAYLRARRIKFDLPASTANGAPTPESRFTTSPCCGRTPSGRIPRTACATRVRSRSRVLSASTDAFTRLASSPRSARSTRTAC